MNDDDLRRLGFVPLGHSFVFADDAAEPVADAIGIGVENAVPEPAQGVAGPAGAAIVPPPVPPPVVVFRGRPKIYFLAVCHECNAGSRPIPMPFGTEADRDRWADGHRTTGHTVDEAVEVRP